MALLITRGLGATEGVVLQKDVATRLSAVVRLKEQMQACIAPTKTPQGQVRPKIHLRGNLTIKTNIHGYVIEKTRIIGKIKDDE